MSAGDSDSGREIQRVGVVFGDSAGALANPAGNSVSRQEICKTGRGIRKSWRGKPILPTRMGK